MTKVAQARRSRLGFEPWCLNAELVQLSCTPRRQPQNAPGILGETHSQESSPHFSDEETASETMHDLPRATLSGLEPRSPGFRFRVLSGRPLDSFQTASPGLWLRWREGASRPLLQGQCWECGEKVTELAHRVQGRAQAWEIPSPLKFLANVCDKSSGSLTMCCY